MQDFAFLLLLVTIVRIMLTYYIDVMGFLEHPEKDWEVGKK